jgi:hypothetical protein
MPRRKERQLVITVTLTGNLFKAYDVARRVLDEGVLQDALRERADGGFVVTQVEIQ